ncbi:MAG: hypothetical protein ACRYGG_07670 [Janthinobacterium lividum]
MDNEEVQITKDRYKELLHSEKILDALYAGGVDNWEWYDESLSGVEDDD